jgi:threonine dehydratase
VEPEQADDAYRSFRDGKIYPSNNPQTIADGLRTQLGPNTFKIVREKVDQIITVSEEAIVDAMEFIWQRMKLIVEPSGAVPLAGILSNQLSLEHSKTGVILSGGNIDLTSFFDKMRQKLT